MRDAALKARDFILEAEPLLAENVMLRFCSIARCVWTGNVKLCGILQKHSHLAEKKHLEIGEGHNKRYA